MTTSIVTADVAVVDQFDSPSLGPTRLRRTTVEVTIDASAVPFARARITTPETIGALQFLQRVDVVLARRFNAPARLGDLAQPTVAQLNGMLYPSEDLFLPFYPQAPWQTVADITALYGPDLNGEPIPAQRRVLHLRPVSVERSTETGETVLEAASAEQLMLEYALTTTVPVYCGPTIRDAVRLALGMAVGDAQLRVHGAVGLGLIEFEARRWEPGTSAWEFVTSVTASAGLRLWCDELDVWHLATAATLTNGAQTIETDPDSSTYSEAKDTSDRQGGTDTGYADAVVVVYRWVDATGAQVKQWDVAGDTGPGSRVLTFELQRPYPGPGEAAARLIKAQRRSATATVRAVIDPSVYVDRDTVLSVDTGRAGRAEAVTWQVPADEMTVTLTEVG